MTERALGLAWDAWRVGRQGAAAVERRQRARLAELVAFARAHSPVYRDLYADLPPRVEDPGLLPVTRKPELMARFDEWATDRAVTLERVRAFVGDPGLVGARFLGQYTVATTSGSTGTPGIFLLDDRSFAVAGAMAVRMLAAWLAVGDVVRLVAARGRMTMVNAMGGHFASAVAATRLRRRRGDRVQVLAVDLPLAAIVAELNRFRPALLAPYASAGALLAGEQQAGRLRIAPVLVVLSAEGLPEREYERIAAAFGAKVRDSYAATECPFLSYRCERGWLHVNSDWVVLKPVDADYHPTPPGEPSHTVLVSNLANRIQPILRYDLGDGVLRRADPCPCGNPFPAIRVQGRAADVLTIPAAGGEPVRIAPLVFSTVADRAPAVELLQVVQTAPTVLRLRVRPAAGTEPERAWQAARAAVAQLLAGHGLGHVTVGRADEPPVQSAGGKYRLVIPLPGQPAGRDARPAAQEAR